MKALSTYYKYAILFFLISDYNNNLNAQCNPDLPQYPAYDCYIAASSAVNGDGNGFICDLDNYCVSSFDAPVLNQAWPFCSPNAVLNNPIWISFIADNSGLLDLSINTYGCTGEGIQWALYDQCGQFFNSVACHANPPITSNTTFEIVTPVNPGSAYYLVLDGSNGTSCNFEFNVNSGISPVPVGEPYNSELSGSREVCPGSIITYSFSGIQYATQYTWTLPGGNVIKTDEPRIDYMFPQGMAEGVYQLCVSGANECDQDNAESLCWDINVVYNKVQEDTLYTCPGDSIMYQGQLYGPGTYDSLPYFGSVLCVNFVNLTVLEGDVPADTTYKVLICGDQNDFIYNGNIYEAGNTYPNEIFESDALCLYPASLQIEKTDTSDLQIYGSKTSLACFGQDTATLYLTGNISPSDRLLNETYIWTGFTGAIIGTGRILIVQQPGEYFLEVISTFGNPSELIDIPEIISCTTRLKFILPDNSVPFPDPVLELDSSQPDAGIYNLNIANAAQFIGGTVFVWQVPSGIEYDVTGNGSISLYLPEKGTYQVCVYAKDICSTSDQVCFDVSVDKTLGNKTNEINGIKLIQNPVVDILRFDFKNLKNDKYSLKVFDINGKAVINMEESVLGYELNLNVEKILSGVYLYRLTNENGQIKTGKFIKI